MFDELISIGIEDPEYYAELLSVTPRDANRPLLSNEHPCPDVLGIHGVDAPLAQRLQTLLDVVADISLCQKGNVSATVACIKQDKDALETQIYIAFNHETDEAARSCPNHLQSIFGMLRQVLYQPPVTDGSPKVIAKELEGKLVEIAEPSTTTHTTSLRIALTSASTSFRRSGGILSKDRRTCRPSYVRSCCLFLSTWT
ncbi:hypothetical protein BGY98DRAFT_132673 [Russula aff. rugulosa BPL654]|nr:hypothetical protein BGY98DRAFT_132673 [Russula aff. rugulosa BPL654]